MSFDYTNSIRKSSQIEFNIEEEDSLKKNCEQSEKYEELVRSESQKKKKKKKIEMDIEK